ncbi:MAG: SIMPL domain-containing protein [Candidatus Omnitrophota bacterium]
MEGVKIFKDSQIIILGVCIAVATVTASLILSQGIFRVMQFKEQVINVTGSAQKSITSDYIVWKGAFARRDLDLPAVYKALQADLEKINTYLVSKKVNPAEIIFSQISITALYKKNAEGHSTNDIEGYVLRQGIEVRSKDVDKITAVSRESTELINQGIAFESYAPDYFYTKLDELKIEMLARATENAKVRVETMVKASGSKIGMMRSARMGVFQITPATSTEVSDYGYNDTSSLEKKVMAVVSAAFAIE